MRQDVSGTSTRVGVGDRGAAMVKGGQDIRPLDPGDGEEQQEDTDLSRQGLVWSCATLGNMQTEELYKM